jgi:murein DD-endopeptidase MepM/ murein hydrolase activator NlpD
MLNEKQLTTYFKLKLPIKDGEFWDGKPNEYSNLAKWRLSFTQRYGGNPPGINYKEKFGMTGHNGIDVAGLKGTPIVAPCKMWLTYTNDTDTGYGINIWGETATEKINGDYYKLEMVFGHFDSIVVKAGRWVQEGELLGYMDSTGFSTGHHLHFGIRPQWSKDGNSWSQMFKDNGYFGYIDPEPFMPHIVWDLTELLPKNKEETKPKPMDLSNFEGEFVVEGEGAGRKGIVIKGLLREITLERTAQACLYYLAKRYGVFTSTKDFNDMPRGKNF